jgi:hypothetical protein
MKKLIASALLAVGLAAVAAFADPTASTPAPAPNEVDYVSQLPAPNDLMNKGVPDGARVAMITQTSSDVSVTYSYANGQVRVVSYRLLPAAGSTAAPGSAPAPAVVATPPPTPAPVYENPSPTYTVVYEEPAPAYYYSAYGYGYPWFWPVSVGIGFHGGWGGCRDGWGRHGGFRR